jgi:hypothetical protein
MRQRVIVFRLSRSRHACSRCIIKMPATACRLQLGCYAASKTTFQSVAQQAQVRTFPLSKSRDVIWYFCLLLSRASLLGLRQLADETNNINSRYRNGRSIAFRSIRNVSSFAKRLLIGSTSDIYVA